MVVAVPFSIALINPSASLTVTALGSSGSAASASALVATLLLVAARALRNNAFRTASFTLNVLVETSVFAFSTAFFKSEEVLSTAASTFSSSVFTV